MAETLTLDGSIEDVIYHNDENGYTVFVIDSDGDPVTCVGYTAFLAEGEYVHLEGNYIVHMEYGQQFKVEYCEKVIPSGSQNILRYLSSGIVAGVRENTAKKIVAAFGEKSLDIMRDEPERLSSISGISLDRAVKIGESYREICVSQELVMFLQEYGVGVNLATRIYKKLGAGAKEIVQKNPYRLTEEIHSIGFKTADQIAMNMGICYNDPNRVKAGVIYMMQSAAAQAGHTYLLRDRLEEYVVNMLGVSDVETENAIVDLLAQHTLILEESKQGERIYLAHYYVAETEIAHSLYQLSQNVFDSVSPHEIADEIREIEAQKGIVLAEEQAEAVYHALNHGTLIITGGPGTGKTTTINTILQIFSHHGMKVALTAPTGRAAKRMTELTGMEAKTIHRLLEINFTDEEEKRFAKDPQHPLDADVVIIDEMSMVDTLLFAALLRGIKSMARVIMIGDCDQLASVGAGNVLEDIIKSDLVKTISLSKIFRQAEESMIVVNAHRINEGYMPILNQPGKDFFFLTRKEPNDIMDAVVDLCKNRIPKQYKVNPLYDIEVLCPTKKGIVGSVNFNEVLQQSLNPPSRRKAEKKHGGRIFRVGDKVMQIRNNYSVSWSKLEGDEEGIGVFNGDMGIVSAINRDTVRVIFDDDKVVDYGVARLDELEHAFAITIHKSQGSEFPVVVMPIYNAPMVLMTRNLLYTAVTRAKQLIILVGKRDILEGLIENNTEKNRFTGLLEHMKKFES